jgi:hypothetical protein
LVLHALAMTHARQVSGFKELRNEMGVTHLPLNVTSCVAAACKKGAF